MDFEIIGFEQGEAQLDWLECCDALIAGHKLPKADITDAFHYRDADTLLTRSAWIDGLGMAVKTATVFPANATHGNSAINGAANLFSDKTGQLEALIDFHLLTKWKTASDSLLAAKQLARADSRNILIVGAGTVARSLREAYGAGFPTASFIVWNRSSEAAHKLAESFPNTRVVADLKSAVQSADIVTSATMSTTPIIKGEWLQPGQHIDLIGAYRPDMREADDLALQRAKLFVDSRETTLHHIGELMLPWENGIITTDDVTADYYDINTGNFVRTNDEEITLFKNGGGAHLDLMTARYILESWKQANL